LIFRKLGNQLRLQGKKLELGRDQRIKLLADRALSNFQRRRPARGGLDNDLRGSQLIIGSGLSIEGGSL
jgi:hypothetical protein